MYLLGRKYLINPLYNTDSIQLFEKCSELSNAQVKNWITTPSYKEKSKVVEQ